MDPIIPVPRAMRLWGVIGAAVAGLFAVWMFFFPSLIAPHFAWVVEPRLAQAFIGAGYIFRTAFFLQFVFARSPTRAYAGLAAFFTLGTIFFTWRQERHRPQIAD